jgi:hypothetical protein
MTTNQIQNEPSRQEIERRAYSLYQERGAIPGRELDDWLTAEKQVAGTSAPPRLPARAEKQTQTSSPTEGKQPAPTPGE